MPSSSPSSLLRGNNRGTENETNQKGRSLRSLLVIVIDRQPHLAEYRSIYIGTVVSLISNSISDQLST
jgi:hypothetical protein